MHKSVWIEQEGVARVTGLRLIIMMGAGTKPSYGLNMKQWACELNDQYNVF